MAETPDTAQPPRPASGLVASLGMVAGLGWCALIAFGVTWIAVVNPLRIGRLEPAEILARLAIGLLAGALLAWPGISAHQNGRRLRNHPTPGYVKSVLASVAVMLFFAIIAGFITAFDLLLPNVSMDDHILPLSLVSAVVFYVFAAWQVIKHDRYEHVHLRDVATRNVLLLLSCAIGLGLFEVAWEVRSRITATGAGSPMLAFATGGIPLGVGYGCYRVLMWLLGVERHDRKTFRIRLPEDEK